ncbi:MAG: hypothetical protein ABS89_06415 [Thiobacillus sp. SCN 63-1177]|nr:MAG: hypothetical protein ABS89_06415 [Thiobacillus sp. SCN 63-1177]OJW49896.1 MAG: hypothetical protein BGO60_06475 [Thiobacillus sp. 65-1059]
MTRKTVILFLNPDPRREAGCNLSLLSLIAGLDPRFHPIVATPGNSAFAELLRERQVETVDYRMNNWWYPGQEHFFRSAAGFQARIRQLAEIIRTRQVRVVHTNAEYAFEGALAAAQTKTPHIWNIRQIFGADMDILRFFPLTPDALGEIMAGLSDRIVPNSQPLIGTFPDSIPADRFHIIPSGVRLAGPGDKPAARAALRKRLALPETSRLIVTMGRISPEKDLKTFIDTARELLRRRPRQNLHFAHFGSMDNAAYFEELKAALGSLSAAVTFAGTVAAPLDSLRGADILLFTSTSFEGLARVCMESLLVELPVVSTRCLGPEEYLIDGETALLADPGDVGGLADQVEKLLDQPELGVGLAQAGGRLVRERYGEERVCAQWMALYDTLAEAGPRNRRMPSATAEATINLISLCGQLGEQLQQQERRLQEVERLTRIVGLPIQAGKRLARALYPFSGRRK